MNTVSQLKTVKGAITVLEPFLRVAFHGDKVVVTWDGNGTLQYTDELLGDGPPPALGGQIQRRTARPQPAWSGGRRADSVE